MGNGTQDRKNHFSMSVFICSLCALGLATSIASAQAIGGNNGEDVQIDQQSAHQEHVKGKARKQPLNPNWALWPPADVDATVPPVASEIACPLKEVLQAVRQRVEELLVNVDRFSAMETIDSAEVGPNWRLRNSQTYRFNYVATVSQTPTGGDLLP